LDCPVIPFRSGNLYCPLWPAALFVIDGLIVHVKRTEKCHYKSDQNSITAIFNGKTDIRRIDDAEFGFNPGFIIGEVFKKNKCQRQQGPPESNEPCFFKVVLVFLRALVPWWLFSLQPEFFLILFRGRRI